jgi:hypothetical protein
MAGGALIVEMIVADGGFLIQAGQNFESRKQRKAKAWGEGRVLTARIEPKEEAQKYHQLKHLHGHLLKPVSEVTGYTERELKDEFKARFLPEDWMTSVTDMNYEQFERFNQNVAECIQLEFPDGCWEACQSAMALFD